MQPWRLPRDNNGVTRWCAGIHLSLSLSLSLSFTHSLTHVLPAASTKPLLLLLLPFFLVLLNLQHGNIRAALAARRRSSRARVYTAAKNGDGASRSCLPAGYRCPWRPGNRNNNRIHTVSENPIVTETASTLFTTKTQP
jgi:hypothetical protein